MKKIGWGALLAVLILAAGCKTVPKPVPSPTPRPTPTPAAINLAPSPDASEIARVDAKAAEAKALREKILELGYNETQVAAWSEANEAWTAAVAARDAADLATAGADYDKAIALYGTILGSGLSSDVENARANAVRMRDAGDALGAREGSPLIWASAEASFASGETALAAASTDKPLSLEAPRTAYRKAASDWETAWYRAKADRLRAGIDERGFASADQGNYDLAGVKYGESQSSFEAGDAKASSEAAQESAMRYGLVWDKAWDLALGEQRVLVDESRRLAAEAKAAKAVPAEWEGAVAVYEEALSLQSSGQYEDSEIRWQEASTLFDQARIKTEEKRVTAERALDSLDARIRSSSGAVETGDAALGGAE